MGGFIREYENVYTRSMSLFSAQCWYRGQRNGFFELTEGNAYLKPLFIYEPSRGTSVYYVVNDPVVGPFPGIAYFLEHPDLFDTYGDAYLRDCEELRLIEREKQPISFIELFRKMEYNWRFLTMVGIMEYAEDTRLLQKTLNLRTKTEDVSYLTENYALERAKVELGARADQAMFLTAEEISTRTFPSQEEYRARRAGYIYYEDKFYPGLSKADFQKRFEAHLQEELLPVQETQSLTGVAAQPGYARGRARLVLSKEAASDVKAGDILVTYMTTPDFLPAMRKAAAIVTDEGGITCHAAIVARELGIPCVIGTKYATRLIHSGDEVEVDAGTGTVTILAPSSPS